MSMDYIKEFRELSSKWDIASSVRPLIEKFLTKVANDAEAKGRNDAVDYIKEVGTSSKGDIGIYCVNGGALESARNTQV